MTGTADEQIHAKGHRCFAEHGHQAGRIFIGFCDAKSAAPSGACKGMMRLWW